MAKLLPTPEQLYKQAGKLVDCARAGDQNAMAIMALVRDNAHAGNLRAQQSFMMMAHYIDQNPGFDFGSDAAEQPDENYWATIIFANAAPLDDGQINAIGTALGDDSSFFLQGVTCWRHKHWLDTLRKGMNNVQSRLIELGRIIGQARALQVLRMPNSVISGYNQTIGWELGE